MISTVDSCGTEIQKKRLRTDPALVARYFGSLPGPHRAVVESTASWDWLADVLEREQVDLTLAHAKLVKAIAYAKVKTDAVDAHTLGQLLRADLVPAAHMISPELRATRDVLRVRLRLVQERGRCQNAIASLLTKYNVASVDALPPLSPAWRPIATWSRSPCSSDRSDVWSRPSPRSCSRSIRCRTSSGFRGSAASMPSPSTWRSMRSLASPRSSTSSPTLGSSQARATRAERRDPSTVKMAIDI